MKNISAILIVLFSLNSFANSSTWDSNCSKFAAPLSGGYCIHTPKKHHSRDIIYYLHGRDGDELEWQDEWFFSEQVRNEWEKLGVRKPTVVSISFGKIWLLAEKNPSPYSGLFEVITGKIIPMIEQGLGGLKGRRIILGMSMGGINSVQLALKTSMFNKAGIICSPMATLSPFSPEDTVRQFIEASGAWQHYKESEPDTVIKAVHDSIQISQGFFPTPEAWEHGDPLKLAFIPKTRKTNMYITVGFYDKYANYEGNEIFVDTLKKQGMRVSWRPQWGGHCAVDIPSLAKFLIY